MSQVLIFEQVYSMEPLTVEEYLKKLNSDCGNFSKVQTRIYRGMKNLKNAFYNKQFIRFLYQEIFLIKYSKNSNN